jgi:tetratricopeptide (TPR) repeat protein
MGTSIKRVFCIQIYIGLVLACLYLLPEFCSGHELDKTVRKAYELRMKGQADSAKVLIEHVLAEDSTHAAAWYELARIKHHIGLGNPRILFTGLDDLQQTIGQAVDYDPDNVIYLFYQGNICFTRVYVSMMRQQPEVRDQVKETISAYESVLKLKPDYYEVKLFLVELLKMVPPDMGGDSVKAEKYTRELEKADVVFGAKAREMIMPEETDDIAFWEQILKNQMDNADVHEALGKAYLHHNRIKEATQCFGKAIQLDAGKNILHVDLGRYYLMQVMQNPALIDSLAPLLRQNFEIYLSSQPEPINPLKAFVLGTLAKISFQTGDQDTGERLNKEAMALDPNYSKAFGIPGQILFDPPDEISHFHAWFSRPF